MNELTKRPASARKGVEHENVAESSPVGGDSAATQGTFGKERALEASGDVSRQVGQMDSRDVASSMSSGFQKFQRSAPRRSRAQSRKSRIDNVNA
jgi:hypothetical protein